MLFAPFVIRLGYCETEAFPGSLTTIFGGEFDKHDTRHLQDRRNIPHIS